MNDLFSTSVHMARKLTKMMKTKKSQKYCEHFEKIKLLRENNIFS